ncbi:hypothetical protein RND81_06G043800 [Saponaria officinalis]|uniref:Uncharacterized protein n=1 Tax=Saponaria officinalis TaxID=3572 RepID=A0AAW1K465_SAPOF
MLPENAHNCLLRSLKVAVIIDFCWFESQVRLAEYLLPYAAVLKLKPLSPFVIDDGDVIKVGETTLIRVWIVEFGEIGGKLPDSREEVSIRVGKEIENHENGDCLGGGEIGGNVEEGSKVDGEARNVGVVESVKTWRGRGKRKKVDIEELNGVENVVLQDEMCRDLSKRVKSSRNSKNVETVMARKDEEVENAGVVDNKKTQGGRGRKKKTDVKELDEAIDSVRDDTGVDFSEIAGSKKVELRESLSEGVMDDVPQQNVVEEQGSSDASGEAFRDRAGGSLCDREQRCDEPACTSTQQNEREDEMNEGFLGKTVFQQCDVLGDATNGSMLVEVEAEARDVLSLKPQPSSEPFYEIDEKGELKDKANIHRLEVEAPKNVDDRATQDDITVGVEIQTPDQVESDLASEDQLMEESASGEIPEETGTDYRGGMKNHEPVPAFDLEKMTLGEWFDYLEAYVPKQIYDVTDEIIDDMRKRAKQFDVFMLEQQQQKAKDKLPMTT